MQVLTVCGLRSVADFDILAQSWKYATAFLFQSEKLREEWEPGAAPIAERVQALRDAHAAGMYTIAKISPTAFPAELMGVVELLRADIDTWKIGEMPSRRAATESERPWSTRLCRCRHRLGLSSPDGQKGLSYKLPLADDIKMWSPDQTVKEKSGEPGRMKIDEGFSSQGWAGCTKVVFDPQRQILQFGKLF